MPNLTKFGSLLTDGLRAVRRAREPAANTLQF